MADAFLSALLTTISGNLNSRALEEFGIALGLKSELQNLKSTFTTIQAVIHDAEKKQRKSEAVKNWLRKLKDAAYDVDDVLDEFATEALLRSKGKNVRNQVSNFFSHRNSLVFRLKMGHKLKNVRDKLDAIAGERSKFHLIEGVGDIEVDDIDWRLTSSLVNESEIYGRVEEKEMVINMLLQDSGDHSGVSVHAIWGMGGLGKTTLAQLVYNDQRVERVFDLRIWVCVSDDFDIRRLTKAIVESIEGSSCNIQELDPLQRRLQEKLRGRRFLLVLDDVWNEYSKKWDELKQVLRCGANESAVIVTTRIGRVASTMATLPVHHLECLSDADSWSLFERHAFAMKMKEEYEHLEAIGKEIVKKCGGLPLAIKAIGSLMRSKSEESEWLFIKDSHIWDLTGDGSTILPALRLSYDHLAPYLRQCFAYCSVYPKEYTMEKDNLIELWMANDFIPSRGQMELHHIGHEIFNELARRSFFQNVECFNGFVTCKMHDLVHDLAQFIMRSECFRIDEHSNLSEMPEKVHHLSICESSSQNIPQNRDLLKVQSLRSFILLGDYFEARDSAVTPFFSKQKYLRILDLSHFNVKKLTLSISNLKHLRYLSMSNSDMETLPESTTCLQNLQTLNLRRCYKLRMLPKGMRHMRNLIYLDIRDCYSLCRMPAGMGQLTYLKKLSTFIVGKYHGHCLNELGGLNLIGELEIKELDNVKNFTDAKSANLIRKRLQSLSLCWGEENEGMLSENVEEVLSGLQPHSSLEKLCIENYEGSKFPDWMTNLLLPNIVEISLRRCIRCERLPNSFPSLESLYIYSMPNLVEWTILNGRESFCRLINLCIFGCPKLVELPILPSLKCLHIESCNLTLLRSLVNFTSLTELSISGFSELTSLPEGVRYLTALEHLAIKKCPKLNSFPEGIRHLTALRRLEIFNCEGLSSLPNEIGHLTSLSYLSIWSCSNLTCLPEGLWSLTTLKYLEIYRCLNLERRYEKEKGQDWLKIAHIPTIVINFRKIQELDC